MSNQPAADHGAVLCWPRLSCVLLAPRPEAGTARVGLTARSASIRASSWPTRSGSSEKTLSSFWVRLSSSRCTSRRSLASVDDGELGVGHAVPPGYLARRMRGWSRRWRKALAQTRAHTWLARAGIASVTRTPHAATQSGLDVWSVQVRRLDRDRAAGAVDHAHQLVHDGRSTRTLVEDRLTRALRRREARGRAVPRESKSAARSTTASALRCGP